MIEDILQIVPRKEHKNIITICFDSNETSITTVVLDFISNTESKKFISMVNHSQ